MKSFKFYSAALAGLLMLGACSSSDDLNGGSAQNQDGKSYIAVNIQSVGAAGAASRADYPQGGNNYEDGTDAEGAIAKVRFFFFNNDGSPYLLKNSTVNYKDVQPDPVENNSADHLHTIEGKTDAIIMIEGETKTAPAYMLAVVNPQTLKNLKDEAYRESQLRDDFRDSQFLKAGKDFVMSNSVYYENGARVCASPVSGHVAESTVAAQKNPVEIYVERVVAKVTADVDNSKNAWKQISTGADAGKYKTKVGEINVSETEKFPVYAVVEGWGLADEDLQADLEKQITKSDVDKWTNAILGINPWTTPDYHRCFWSSSVAITPAGGDNPIGNHAYSDYTATFGATTPKYTCPNTPTYTEFYNNGNYIDKNENSLTKVLVAAKLVYYDKDNNAHVADICKYRGMEILGENSVKTQIAQDYKEYYTVDPSDASKHIALSSSDLDYTRNKLEGEDPLKGYEVRPVLKSNVKVYQLDETSHQWIDKTTDLNKKLADSPVQVRHEGMTYYYTPIRHLASNEKEWGYYGVVRNHSYRVTINSISGFGTPVYNPKEVIDPTIPKDTETYLAARVNVLSWRVVSSSVNLDQTNK